MTDFPPHSIAESDGEIKGLLRSMQVKFGGMEANQFAYLANSPTALKAYIGLMMVFERSTLTPAQQQLVQLTVSRQNECRYCVPLHSTNGFIKGLHPDVIGAVREDRSIETDEQLEALRVFTKSVMKNQGRPDDEQVKAFIHAGFTQEHVLDIVTGIALKTISNYANHIMQTPLDEPFEMNKWDI